MLKKVLLAGAVAVGLAIPAQAKELTRLPDQVVGVEQPHHNPAGAIIGDTIGGAVAGAAVGGGVVLFDHYVNNSGNGGWGNWQRTIAIGAGVGAGIGLLFGVVDAASSADRAPTGALVDQRDTGFAPTVAQTPAFRF